MFKKNCVLISIAVLCCITSISFAADNIWNNNFGNNDWSTTSNWSLNRVPTGTDYARVKIANGPVFSSGTSSTSRIYIEGTNGTLTINGGTLNTTSHIYMAPATTDTSTLNVNGGALNIATSFYVGRDGASNVNLLGGTLTCNAIYMRTNNGIGIINITAGKLIVNGDVTVNIGTWAANGWIKAYDGAGTLMKDYNITTLGKTTVWAAVPTKAGGPSPVNNATNVSVLTDLSWTGVVDAISHDVYFGTAIPETGQNTTATTFDVGRLNANTTYYWRIDEVTGSGTTTGDVWSFTTGSLTATNPNPANDAINVSTSGTTLSWTAGVTATSHNVYFGTTNPPASIGNQTGTTYNPGTLTTDKTYYWRIDEVEDGVDTYTGTVWSFASQGSIKKGPYLMYPGNNSQMTVLWQMPNTIGCTLAWGLDTSYSTGSTATTEYGTDHQHKYTLTGLTPGTKYYYRVTAGAAQATGSFKTAPAADATAVKFLAYGDTRSYPADHSTICASMNSLMSIEPDFQTMLLHVGDWVNTDAETNWTNEFFNRSYTPAMQMQATLPIQGAIGNHEGNATYYTKYWPYPYVSGKYWSFDYGPVHIAVVDQYSSAYNSATSPQMIWLANDLSSSTKKWKIIILHNPGWSAGGGHGNDENVQNYIQPLCVQYGVQIVFAGHNHYYSRAIVNGVHHITTGAGGAPLYNPVSNQPYIQLTSKTYEYCKVTIDGNSLICQVVKPDNTVIDEFQAEHEEPDFTFIHETDPQIGWAQCGNMDDMWPVAVNKANIINPAFMIITGDLINSQGSTTQAAYFNNYASQLTQGIGLYNVPGNHDVGDTPNANSYAFWNTYLRSPASSDPNVWYSFTYGNNLFICLDSMGLKNPSGFTPRRDADQMDWLTTTLQNSGGYDNVMVFMHIPICMTAIDEADGTNNMPLAIRNQLLNLFHTYGVKAVFSGHAHYNSYVRDVDLELITTSSSNCSLGSTPTPQGFRIVKVFQDHIEHEYVPFDDIISPPAIPGDLNGDGTVDLKDMYILTGHWLEGGLWP